MFLEHVNVTVSDVDRSVELYKDLFALSVRWRGKTAGGLPAAHVGNDRHYIAFFQAERPGRVEKDYTAVGMNHFGLVVDDLEEMKRRLASKGIEPHAEQDYEPGHRLYFFDPDGIEVELVEYES